MRRGHPAAEAIVPQVALGYFLMHTNTKPLDFEPEKLLREEQSLGWDLARARAHNGNGSGAATPSRPRTPTTASPWSSRRCTGATCSRRSSGSTSARWPTTSPTSRAGTSRSDREPHVQEAIQAALAQGARGLGLEAAR